MTEFKVLNVESTIENIKYLQYNLVILTIPNLEKYNVSRDSVLNFQTRLFYELNDLFWDSDNPQIYIRIHKNESYYKYIIRVTNTYNLKNILVVRTVVNNIFERFPFKYISKKRRNTCEEYISYKVQKLNI